MAKAPKQKIDTLIISDIHLGDQIVRSRELLALLQGYDMETLILNGDILNGLKFQRLHSDHWKILSALRELTKTKKVIWIHGNHDADVTIISRLLGIKTMNKYLWEAGGKKFLAIHGHQFDRFLNDSFLVSQAAFFIYNLLKKSAIGRFVLDYMKNNNQAWKRNSEGVARGALRLALVMNADFVFCGHTHQIDEQVSGKIKYFNTGSWTEAPSAYITIKEGTVSLHRVV